MKKQQAITLFATTVAAVFTSGAAFGQSKSPLPSALQTKGKGMQKWDSTQAPSRMVFLNGVNIGNVRDQELQNVTVRIDSAGNISIVAPQYDVSRETSYHPLLPAELPRFPKSQAQYPGIPENRYSRVPGNESPVSASTQPAPFQDMRTPASSNSFTAETRMPESRAELKTNVGSETPATLSQESTPVGASQKLSVPPVSSPDIPSDARGERM